MTEPPYIAGEIRVTSHRRVWVALSMSRLTCLPTPDGHRIRDPLVWEHGCLRCKHQSHKDKPVCRRLVYLVGGGLVTPIGKPLVLLASVTDEEMAIMSESRMDYKGSLDFLGIRFPG